MGPEFNVMEAIWVASEKGSDDCLHYPPEFIDFLWETGFIDTQQYSKETWRAAFEPFVQADGTYKLNHDEFLSLDPYRYRGEIRIPFDAMRINEGKYTDEGLDQLVRDSIQPSCGLPPQAFDLFLQELKKEFRQPDDLILIKGPAKQKIKKLLDDHPSPLRRLELLFDHLLTQKGAVEAAPAAAAPPQTTATPQQQAEVQKSAFLQGTASLAEMQAKRLKEIAKAKPMAETKTEGPGEPLKKVKRSKKGMRG